MEALRMFVSVQGVPPIDTVVPVAKLVPVIKTLVFPPSPPLSGDMEVTVGALRI
jgi:hypothetical protein